MNEADSGRLNYAGSSRVSRVRSFLQCTSCRYTSYYFLAFCCGLGSHLQISWIAFGIVYWFVHSSTTEALNRVADRAIDVVNRPERTALCEQIGYGRMRVIAYSGYVLLILLGGVWIAWVPTVLVILLLLLSDFIVYNYSLGLRLSRRRYGSVVVLAFPFVGPFAGGWAMAHRVLNATAWHEFVGHSLPVLITGGLMLASLSWVKDVTDMIGDRLIGFRSGWVALVRGKVAVIGAIIASVPFGVLAILVALGGLPLRYLVMLGFLPVAILLANGTRLAAASTEQMAVRELFYNYWMVALAVLAMLTIGAAAGVVVAVASFLYWRLATAFLHWTGAEGAAGIPGVLRLNFRGRGSQLRRAAP